MSRLKNFHSKHYRTKKLDPGKGTKGSFGRGLRGFRDTLTAGAIFPEAALANAIKKGLTGEGLEGFEDSPKGMRKGGTAKKKKREVSTGSLARKRRHHKGCGKAIMPNRRKKTLYVGSS